MTQLRKINSYILPLMVVGLLFSIVVSVSGVVGDGEMLLFPRKIVGGGGGGGGGGFVYIGKIDCDFDNNTGIETFTLDLYSDSQLISPIGQVRIYMGGAYGLPIGLIATATSAQAQRTKVVVTQGNVGGVNPVYAVTQIDQYDNPDDIAAMFGGVNLNDVNNRTYDAYWKIVNQSPLLDDIYYNQLANIKVRIDIIDNVTDSHLLNDFSQINGQVSNIKNNENRVIDTLSTLTPTLSSLTTTLGSVKSRTDTLNPTISNINATINGDDTLLINESVWINNTISSQNVLIQDIYNKTVK